MSRSLISRRFIEHQCRCLPETASSAYVQKRAGTQQPRPTGDCERGSADSLCKGPENTHWVLLSCSTSLSTSWKSGDRPYLNVLCESVEDLFGYIDCFGEIPLALFIDDVFPRIVPVEIADGLLRTRAHTHTRVRCVLAERDGVHGGSAHLDSEQVIHRRYDDVDRCVVTRLRSQVVLKIWCTNTQFLSLTVL